MPELPTLGDSPKKSPLAGVAITAALVGALAGGAYWWKSRVAPPPAPAPVAAAAPSEAVNAVDPAAPAAAVAVAPAPGTAAAAPAPLAAGRAEPSVKGGLKSI